MAEAICKISIAEPVSCGDLTPVVLTPKRLIQEGLKTEVSTGSRESLLPQDIKTKPKQNKNHRALGSALSSDPQHKADCLTSHLGDPHV